MMEASGLPLLHALGWTLLHFCWQGAAVALLSWCGLGVLPARWSRARYGVACAALALMVALPAATFVRLAKDELAARRAFALPVISIDMAVSAGSAGVPPVPLQERVREALDRSAPWLPVIWLAGVMVFLARLNAGLLEARRLRSAQTEAATPELLRLFEAVKTRLGVVRVVKLAQSALVQVPTVIGWLRPVVLLPVGCFLGLSEMQVEALLAHELAHIRRHDYLVSVVQSVVETLLFYHPAVWWVSRQVRRERECCCDDLAVGVAGDRLAYARALSWLEERRAAMPEVVLGANGGVLKMRIRRLLGYAEEPVVSRPAVATMLVVAVVVAGSYVVTLARAQTKVAVIRSAEVSLEEPAELTSLIAQKEPVRPLFSALRQSTAASAERSPAMASSRAAQATASMVAVRVAPEVSHKVAGSAAQTAAVTAQPAAQQPVQPAEQGRVYTLWLNQDVVWIITPEDRAAFLKLTSDEERGRFIEQFWARRAAPGTAANSFKDEHYARIAYANEHFGAGAPGWTSDRGHIYIVYGRPQSIDAHPAGDTTSGAAPFEVWHYGSLAGIGDNVDLRFEDSCRCGQYRLEHSAGAVATVDGSARPGAEAVVLDPRSVVLDPPAGVRLYTYTPAKEPMRVSAGVMRGNLISRVDPVYPAEAKAAHVQGAVILHAVISREGAIDSLQFISGPEALRQSAMDAVQQWRYKPYLLNGKPMAVDTTITVNFSLGGPVETPEQKPEGGNADVAPKKLGPGITPPVVIYQVDPEFSEEARKAHVSGAVQVGLWVDEQGNPTHVHMVRGVGVGRDGQLDPKYFKANTDALNDKAVAAVKQYRFTPAMEDGKPVAVQVNIEVNFRFSE